METRANRFDERVGKIQMVKAIGLSTGNSALDIGCGKGQFTPMLSEHFDRVVGVDGSEENVEIARRGSGKCEFVVGLAESFDLNEKFDTVFMTMILEHVEDPVSCLRNARKHMNKGGRCIVQVPNAESMNRLLGLYMGIVEDIHELGADEIKKYGHRRVYDKAMLIKDMKSAGFEIGFHGGLVFKPFTNQQMQKICDGQTEEWIDSFMNALVEIGYKMPSSCTTIFAVGI